MILSTHNLEQVAGFPTTVSRNKGTLIDNIFLGKAKQSCISVYSIKNGLPDQDTQVLILDRTPIPFQKVIQKK